MAKAKKKTKSKSKEKETITEEVPKESKDSTEEKASIKTKSDDKQGLVAIIILAVIAALFILPTTVTYQEQETYPVQEAYQVQVQKDLKYQVTNSHSNGGLSGLNWVSYGKVYIENMDTVPGTFVVNCNFRTVDRTLTDNDRVYILPGEVKVANCQADTKYGEDTRLTYDITPGKKTVTETKYRTIEKSRTVTKQREVRLYQKLLGSY